MNYEKKPVVDYRGIKNVSPNGHVINSRTVNGLEVGDTVIITKAEAERLHAALPGHVELLDEEWTKSVLAEGTVIPGAIYKEPTAEPTAEPDAAEEIPDTEPTTDPVIDPVANPVNEPATDPNTAPTQDATVKTDKKKAGDSSQEKE